MDKEIKPPTPPPGVENTIVVDINLLEGLINYEKGKNDKQ